MCDCIKQMNEKLAEYNAAIVTTMLSDPERLCVETYKVDATKRGFRPPKVLSSYCPFCGERHAAEADPKTQAA